MFTGNERLHSHSSIESLENVTVLDFWSWAFSNLQMNDVRGVFAEWMVAKLLDIPLSMRDSWGECDLVARGGVRIEVKTSAYLQAWAQKQPSRIVFAGLKGRRLNTRTNQYARTATYNADIYVFCVQIEKDPDRWDALDLDQWRFYLMTRLDIEQLDQKSLSLGALAKMCPEMRANEFRAKATAMIDSIGRSLRSLAEVS